MNEFKSALYPVFEEFCRVKLQLQKKYPVIYTSDKSRTKTYGHFEPSTGNIVVYTGTRSLGDIFRTVAHELVHMRQFELGLVKPDSGKTGSDIENKANAAAGIIMRQFGQKYPEIYN